METTRALTGLECTDCGDRTGPTETPGRCRVCGGITDPTYDLDEVDLTPETLADRRFDGLWRYEELLPFPRSAAVTLGEGETPLVRCPTLAGDLGVGTVLVKDEGHNPTGSFKDRGQTVAVTAAVQHGARDVALATAGNAGHAAAAYAARAGLDAHVFVPARAGFTPKAGATVHGADVRIVEGRIRDAGAALEDALEGRDWHQVQTFVTPYRHEGKKTMLYEIVEQLDWSVPDHIVYPTGGGVGLVGMYKGARELRELGWTDRLPAMYAAQSTGCAPIVAAHEAGRDRHDPWEDPDTVCAGIEIPDPGASRWILECLRETDGDAVATDDEDILDGAAAVAAAEGIEMGVTAAAAVSGARELADGGAFDADDTVVLMNTAAGMKDIDLVRSHLAETGT